jgi:hypothetical protein
MSIHKAIDQIVEAFIPEMEKISRMGESEEQKDRHYKAWLRATLQKFANEVREIEARNGAEGSRDHHAV